MLCTIYEVDWVSIKVCLAWYFLLMWSKWHWTSAEKTLSSACMSQNTWNNKYYCYHLYPTHRPFTSELINCQHRRIDSCSSAEFISGIIINHKWCISMVLIPWPGPVDAWRVAAETLSTGWLRPPVAAPGGETLGEGLNGATPSGGPRNDQRFLISTVKVCRQPTSGESSQSVHLRAHNQTICG